MRGTVYRQAKVMAGGCSIEHVYVYRIEGGHLQGPPDHAHCMILAVGLVEGAVSRHDLALDKGYEFRIGRFLDPGGSHSFSRAALILWAAVVIVTSEAA